MTKTNFREATASTIRSNGPTTDRRSISGFTLQDALFSPLLRRIVAVNLIGLALLVCGVLALNEYRERLVELREEGLETQAQLISKVLASNAAMENAVPKLDPLRVAIDLQQLIGAEGARAQLFDRAARLTYDNRLNQTRQTPNNGPMILPVAGAAQDSFAQEPVHNDGWLDSIISDFRRDWRSILYGVALIDDSDILGGVARSREVFAALGGLPTFGRRVNSKGELIVSISMPIERRNMVLSVLVLSTPGGDIDKIVADGRVLILQIFMVALTVAIVTATIMARSIAMPVQQLAAAAEAAEGGTSGDNERARGRIPQIPDMTDRNDEIGDLSGALRRMTDDLSSRLEATESFAADVAHEIKNPLTSLRSAVETMRHVNRDDARLRLLAIIEHDVIRLDRLLTDISAASRLDAELVRAHRQRFDLSAQLTELVELNRCEAEQRGITIKLEQPNHAIRLRGIDNRIAQIFQNLITNAISFSPNSGTIRIRLIAPPFPGAMIRVLVMDEGPGIPLENLEHIFQRFYSERPDYEDFGDHSGLGLSISRQITEAHSGRISADNLHDAKGRVIGARFTVELPS